MIKALATTTLIIVGLAAASIFTARAEKMHDVKVDIGKNIVTTAKNSGAPRWGTESHWGLKIYELVNLRPEVNVIFSRPDFEINANPLFALTMYADSENNNNLAVTNIEFQYAYNATTHENAKIFIEEILRQFRKGKWKRYIRDSCPAISGRSSFLDENGKVGTLCAIDSAYDLSMEDWLKVMRSGGSFEWIGDNVLAILTVNFDVDTRGLTYNIDMEFHDFAIKNRHDDAEQARVLAEGDQKGWKSTEDYKKGMEENKRKMKIIEANALLRGDHIVPRE